MSLRSNEQETMTTRPLVSIYVPTYNRRQLLERAIESARSQTLNNIEIIVVDDCSSDDTREYLQSVAKEDPRVRFFLKPVNSGACASRNIAIRNARGKLATGLDDDDYILPTHVEGLVKLYDTKRISCTSPLAVFPQMATRSEDGSLDLMQQPLNEVGFGDLIVKNLVGNQVLTSTSNFLNCGLFNERLPAWQDYDLWLRLANSGTRFIKAENASYIYEKESGAGQISHKSHKKILEAYQIVSSNPDLSLNKQQRLLLKLNYYRYPQSPMPIADLRPFFREGLFTSPTKTAIKKIALKAMASLHLQ